MRRVRCHTRVTSKAFGQSGNHAIVEECRIARPQLEGYTAPGAPGINGTILVLARGAPFAVHMVRDVVQSMACRLPWTEPGGW